MNNEKFVFKGKRDFTPEPEDFSIRKFSCHDFFVSTKNFIDRNFAGAMSFDFSEGCKGFVHISPRGFAYFIRLLLSEIYGRSMAVVKVSLSDDKIILTVSGVSVLKSEEKLIDAALRSGFSCSRSGDILTLTTPLKITQEMFVYANEILELINYYYEIFLM